MQKFEQAVNQIIIYIISATLFLVPLFFLPITRDFLIYTKFYFIFFTVIILVILSFVKFLFAKRFFWAHNPFIQAFLLLLFAYGLSILLQSPNRIQAFFNPQFGFFAMVSMIGYYLYATQSLARERKIQPVFLLTLSGFISAIISLIFLINPFKNVQLSPEMAFLKSQYFNTIGNQFELLAFFTFVIIAAGLSIWSIRKNKKHVSQDLSVMYMVFLGVIVIATVSQLYIIGKALISGNGSVILPPISISWYAAVEILKDPMTALFGIGVDNFASIFTKVRDVQYNTSNLWQIASFSSSRSTFLHIFTETGILGLSAFIILLVRGFQQSKKAQKESTVLFIFSTVILFLLPPSLLLFFLFFTSLAMISADIQQKENHERYEVDLSQTLPLYIGLVVVYILFTGASTFLIGKHLLSEIYFKKSIDAIGKNDLKGLYENQRTASMLNPYNEDFRINFAQTNLLVANNLAGKKKEEITDNDRKTISQAIQASIAEGKAAVALNDQKVNNWQNLAGIYKNIINVAKDAELWTVTAYQRAIIIDPQNPIHRVELGGVFYLFGNYAEAQKLFEQATSLKPDWANAHYNLAWSYAQLKDYPKAIGEMQNVLSLLDPKKSEADFKKAQKDIEEFKKNLPKEEEQSVENGKEQPADLNLPTPPTATVEPKIQLNETASPESTQGGALNR